jgi:uncharacterized membrane-anchored protein
MMYMNSTSQDKAKIILSKVPEVTIFFWVIKILCTTVGETFSDFINVTLGLGLTLTTVIMGAAFLVSVYLQVRAAKYYPGLYWLTVVLISVFGTLVTDNLTDGLGVPLEISTVVFSALLITTFLLWYLSEGTLSIHSVYTRKREVFYWLTILFTFALGTALGDLYSEQLGLGYLLTGIIVACIIGLVYFIRKFFNLDSVLAFWVAYIFTRPLGASLGDYLSQPQKYGGLGLGTTITSLIFLLAIFGVIIFLALSKCDVKPKSEADGELPAGRNNHYVLAQTIAVLCAFLVAGAGGYFLCTRNAAQQATSSETTLHGQLNDFITIEKNMLSDISSTDISSAKAKADDLEHSWDISASKLKKIDKAAWTDIDGSIDSVLSSVRSGSPDSEKCKTAINRSLDILDSSNR